MAASGGSTEVKHNSRTYAKRSRANKAPRKGEEAVRSIDAGSLELVELYSHLVVDEEERTTADLLYTPSHALAEDRQLDKNDKQEGTSHQQ